MQQLIYALIFSVDYIIQPIDKDWTAKIKTWILLILNDINLITNNEIPVHSRELNYR